MNEKDILKKLKEEGKVLDKKVENKNFDKNVTFEKQPKPKRKIFALATSLVLVLAVAIGGIATLNRNEDTTFSKTEFYMSMDINPSVEFTGDAGIIDTVRGLNSDGLLVLKTVAGEILGKTPEEGAVIFAGSAKELGYIDSALPNGAIVFNVTAGTTEKENEISQKVAEKANDFLKDNNISGEVIAENQNTELKELAKKHNVTVGRMNFILKAMEKNPALTIEELITKEPKEINELIKGYNKDKMDQLDAELDKMEEEFEKIIEEKEREFKEKFEEIKGTFSFLEQDIKIIKTVEDLAKFIAEIQNLKEIYPELSLNTNGLKLSNLKNFEKELDRALDKFEDFQERELEKLERELEKEEKRLEKEMRDKAGLYDDDDDDDNEELNQLKDQHDKTLSDKESELEEEFYQMERELDSIVDRMKDAKSEEDLKVLKDELASLKKRFPNLNLNEKDLTLSGVKSFEKKIKEELDRIDDLHDRELDQLEKDLEKEEKKLEEELKANGEIVDDDDDDDDDDESSSSSSSSDSSDDDDNDDNDND